MSFRRHRGAIHESVFTKGALGHDGAEFTVIGPYAANGDYARKDDVGLQIHLGGFTFCVSIPRDAAHRLGELLIASAEDEIAPEPIAQVPAASASLLEVRPAEPGETFEARFPGEPFVWGRGATDVEAIRDAKEPLLDSGSKDIEMDMGRLVVTKVIT